LDEAIESPSVVDTPQRPALNFRSFTLGTGLVILTSALAPYNDYVVGNGFLIACYLPVVFVFCMFVLMVAINAPLRRWWPTQALAGNEMGVVSLMMLVGCSLCSQGLLRSFLPALVHPFYHGGADEQFWRAFTAMGLPRWLFPVGDIASGRNSTVVKWFYTRVPDGEAIPYRAWVLPLMGWGVFFGSLFLCIMSLAKLVYPQWANNERLAFPIAQVELAMIAPPAPGKMFNALYSNRLFWIGAAIAFFLQNQAALHLYFPKRMPEIPLYYDFTKLLTAEPWVYLSSSIKANKIVFVYLAMGYLAQARVGFSVWASYILLQIAIICGQMFFHRDTPGDALVDQHLGASVVLMIGVFWVGRQYWKKVLLDHRVGGRLPLLLAIVGLAGMVSWLKVVGVQLPMCVLIVAFLLLGHLVTARIVAETGMPMFRCYGTPGQVYLRMNPHSFTGRDVYFAQFLTAVGAYTTRESGAVFLQHGLWVLNRSDPDYPKTKSPPPVGWLIAWTLIVSFVVGSISSLHCYYRYATPLSPNAQPTGKKINYYTADTLQNFTTADRLVQHAHGEFAKPSWNPGIHISAGAIITAILLMLSLRSASWPLVPVGYILATIPFAGWVWYSVFAGWLAKVLIMRFGGAKMFQDYKPLFIGLIIGEALAAAMWLAINLVLANMHYDYRPIILYAS
jgi:hypothetical protein